MVVLEDRELIASDIEGYLAMHQNKSLLRFLTCGSVDDGKSTLIGRLLYEAKAVFDDQLATLVTDSARVGTQGGGLDFALLVDGLSAEREQGITIDVAYRYFSTNRRTFIVADTPGHEQYTRNMVTGASTADLAIILVDARHGVLTQTRRHSFLVSLLGIRQVVLAVNKLDAVDYSEAVFTRIVEEYREFGKGIGLPDPVCIPVSALQGDNITSASPNTPWYDGPALLGHLESVDVESSASSRPFRLPVQWVNRPTQDFRGFAGLVTGGSISPGDEVQVIPGGQRSRVSAVVGGDGELPGAAAGQSVTLVLADEVDVSRGDVLCAADQPCRLTRNLEADIVWMSEAQLRPRERYLLKLGTATVGASVAAPSYRVEMVNMRHEQAMTLGLNEIGRCQVSLDKAVAFDPYTDDRDLGGFILMDRLTNETVAAGMVRGTATPGVDVHWQRVDVDRAARSQLAGHQPAVVWLTGLSGAGKSTIANLVERRLHAQSVRTYLLDGDNVRHGLNRDLDFSEESRKENIRRIGEVAAMMVDAGMIVIVAAISPFAADRDAARARLGDATFVEVFVDAPLAITEERDVKGLYAKARAGGTRDFTGVTSRYEPPVRPEIHVDTTDISAVRAAEQIVDHLISSGVLDATTAPSATPDARGSQA